MEIFDSLNLYLLHHPVMLAELELAFRMKFWLLLAVALYFITLPNRHNKKKQAELSSKPGHFLA